MGVLWQILGTCIVCFINMNMGILFTWPSSTIKNFQSSDTILNRPMSTIELALFSSLSSIGALISTPLGAYALDKYGRHWCCIASSMAHVTAWTLIAASTQVEVILLAIFMSGIGGNIYLIAPMYVSEFCQESIRGAMISGSILFSSFGMLISYIFGGYLEYRTMIYTSLTLSAVGTLMLGILKESPMYLMQKGMEEEAKKSVAFFRKAKLSSKEVLEELNVIKRALNPDMEESISEEEEKLKQGKPAVVKPKEQLSLMQFIKKSPSTRRALFVGITMIVLSIFQGIVVVQVYAEPLFEEALPTVSPTLCSIAFALVTVLAGLGTAYLSDVAGRRALMIYASTAGGILSVLLGTQIQLKWAPHAFTAVCIYMLNVVYTLGAGTIPFVYAAEVFLPEVKSFVTMLIIEVAWLSNFIILFIFNPLVEAVGLGIVFHIFGAVCFTTSIFCAFFMPETKGLAVDAIQALFTNKKKRSSRV